MEGAVRIFYDTEFLEDGRTIELISIGMVAEDGREFYAVNREAPWDRIREHPWLMANVVPHLPPGGNSARGSLIDLDHPSVRLRQDVADGVRDLIQSTPDPQLWAWYAGYDHVALCQLFGRMNDLPPGVPMCTNELQQAIVAAGEPSLPPEPPDSHRALVDARHARAVADAVADAVRQARRR
jgi:hypothetical protein